MPTVEQLASALIASFEGLRLDAYQDIKGIWTIGFGHTGDVWPGTPVSKGLLISADQATQLLKQDCAPLFRLVTAKPILEAAALVSFGYNCGIGSLQHVLSGSAKLTDFDHINGVVNDALQRRRTLEQALIDTSRGM